MKAICQIRNFYWNHRRYLPRRSWDRNSFKKTPKRINSNDTSTADIDNLDKMINFATTKYKGRNKTGIYHTSSFHYSTNSIRENHGTNINHENYYDSNLLCTPLMKSKINAIKVYTCKGTAIPHSNELSIKRNKESKSIPNSTIILNIILSKKNTKRSKSCMRSNGYSKRKNFVSDHANTQFGKKYYGNYQDSSNSKISRNNLEVKTFDTISIVSKMNPILMLNDVNSMEDLHNYTVMFRKKIRNLIKKLDPKSSLIQNKVVSPSDDYYT